MKITDDKLDILKDLETRIAQVWREHPEMTDYAVLRAYEAAVQLYRAEQRGQTPKPPVLSGLDAAAFEALKAACEFRLGRGVEPEQERVALIPLETLLDCLRELAKSVGRHTKEGGRQGYLTFIDRFLP